MDPNIENMTMEEYWEYESEKEKEEVKQPSTSQYIIQDTPPYDAYDAQTANPILELLEEFGDELLDITMVDEEADCNPTRDVDELDCLIAKDHQSSLTEIKEISCMEKTNEEFEPFIHIQQLSPLYKVSQS
ncbi:hypothetical protein Tco_0625022 [Tanacetum coccineum]|uniref:Uncharacterized protein n=1 Tax=Tanacetum coccineum TaxID=301880 RepID=A0ABQ4WFL2_9ASTR